MLFQAFKEWIPFASSARTATATSGAENSSNYNALYAVLDITAVSGTTPTLDVKFQTSVDGSVWVDIASGAFSQKTATGTDKLEISGIARYLRVVATIGGTTPSFTFSLKVSVKGVK